MNLSLQVLNQVLVIFILMMTGAILFKAKIIESGGVAQMSKILVTIVMPAVIIKAYQTDFNGELLKNLLCATLLALALHIIAILLSMLIFRKNNERNAVNIFSVVYSNCGFMGIPLLTAVYGDMGAFYGSAYFAVFTILSWTHGIWIYSKGKTKIDIKKIIFNPGIIGIVIALVLFFARIKLPFVVYESVNYLAMLNTPLAMIILGTYMAKLNFKDITDKFNILIVSVLKLAIIPLVGIAIIRLLNIAGDVTGAVIIGAACPTAAIASIFASQYDSDAVYATVVVVITTLLSIATIPLLVTLL